MDTAATNNVLFESPLTEKTPGPAGVTRRRAAAAPAGTPPWEAAQERNATDTAATNNVPFESAPTEKTPGPAGRTQRRRPIPDSRG
ncbi:hypothetical protein NDU88_005813 [Pleurodeles waltl]|uniref:Uncharacterized protein n=1 Tax=Pleurodeles waltl TaxID=8319 RepID=A0AAV7VK60_PLEWA|nr:hypothetical protein NDU88_005813 [Pleurodeles waltl]